MWDPHKGKRIYTLEGHSAAIAAIDFSPDGDFVVSAAGDTIPRLWHTKRGDLEHMLGTDLKNCESRYDLSHCLSFVLHLLYFLVSFPLSIRSKYLRRSFPLEPLCDISGINVLSLCTCTQLLVHSKSYCERVGRHSFEPFELCYQLPVFARWIICCDNFFRQDS